MSEVDWGTQDNQATPKKRVPTWVWITGGCCGVALIAGIALVVAGAFATRKMMNQDASWEGLAKVVQFDPEAKADVTIVNNFFGAMMPGVDGLWQLTDSQARWQTTIVQFDAKSAEDVRNELFQDSKSAVMAQLIGALAEHQIEIGKLDVQGRSLSCRRFVTEKIKEGEAAEAKDEKAGPPEGVVDAMASVFKKSCVALDVTPEGAPGLVLLAYARLGSLARVPDEEVADYLRPYHIGPNR